MQGCVCEKEEKDLLNPFFLSLSHHTHTQSKRERKSSCRVSAALISDRGFLRRHSLTHSQSKVIFFFQKKRKY